MEVTTPPTDDQILDTMQALEQSRALIPISLRPLEAAVLIQALRLMQDTLDQGEEGIDLVTNLEKKITEISFAYFPD